MLENGGQTSREAPFVNPPAGAGRNSSGRGSCAGKPLNGRLSALHARRFLTRLHFVRRNAMSVSTMTTKGQTTIPKDIRDGLGLKPKDQIHFTMLADGTVIMRAKKRSLAELYGALRKPGRKPVELADMTPWR
jgi:AbrB family looped-hinge helix DNA binding protein